MNVGILGLGRMGRAIAGRLIDGGHDITVWNRTTGRADDLVGRGAVEAPAVSDAVQGADVVFLALSGDDAVREVLLPDGRALPGLDGVVVDCSTVAPATSREEADGYPDRFVACPIAGAPQAVAAGTALLIVGGAAAAVDRAAPALDALSPSRHFAGADPGAAAIVKLVNNYLLLAGLAVLADAVAVAQANGFADDDVRELLTKLPLVAPGLKNRIDGLIGDRHDPWFTVQLGSKDLRLFTEVADRAGAQLGVAEATRSRYHEAVELGFGERDLTAIIETLRGSESRRTQPRR